VKTSRTKKNIPAAGISLIFSEDSAKGREKRGKVRKKRSKRKGRAFFESMNPKGLKFFGSAIEDAKCRSEGEGGEVRQGKKGR